MPIANIVISGASPVYPQAGSLQINRSLNQRDTANFELYTGLRSWTIGATVVIRDFDSVILFAGRVETVEEHSEQQNAGLNQSTNRWWNVSCVSHDKLLDRRYATGSWTGQTMGYIVRDLVNTYLAADGLGVAGVEDGPIIPQYDVPELTRISDILSDLSRQTKFPYYVEMTNALISPVATNLHMFDPNVSATVFSLTEGTKYESLHLEQDLTDYRNRQYVVTGDLSSWDPFAGSGAAPQTVTLSQQAAQVTSVSVDGNVKSIGILGTDTGKDWYYTVNSTSVVQDAAGAAIPSTSTIKVKYFPRKADTFAGDGVTTVFTTSKSIRSVTSIVLNGGTPLNVGVLGTDPLGSKDWLYSVNGTRIQQGQGGAVLPIGSSLVVDYEPVPGVVMKENTAEQTYRSSVEGGTGIHEAVEHAGTGGTLEDAIALAAGLLAEKGVSIPGAGRTDIREIRFRVTTAREPQLVSAGPPPVYSSPPSNLQPGARVGVNLSASKGATGTLLVSGSNISDREGAMLVYDVRLTRDHFEPDWEQFFEPAAVASDNPATSISTASPDFQLEVLE